MLYAKRHYEQNQLIEETLEQHIGECLKVYEKIIQLIPCSPVDIKDTSLTWKQIVFILVAFHDMGKASSQFQNITLNLESHESWHFRHEVLSAEFLDLLNIEEGIKTAVKIAILGHHEKSINELSKVSYSDVDCVHPFGKGFAMMIQKRQNIYANAKQSVFDNWDECIDVLRWIQLEYEKRFDKKLEISLNFKHMGSICDLLEDYENAILEQENKYPYKLILFLKGILITCDHLGSGHNTIYDITSDILEWYKQKFQIGIGENDFRSTQKVSNTKEDSILIAPTGTGKTEAAFIWANNHLVVNAYRRVLYVLPYTASIIGMYSRLQKEPFATGKVDMKHGKSLYAYYYNLLEAQQHTNDLLVENKKEIQATARLMRQTSKEISKPIKIVTPYQIIKAFYRAKGYETLLTEFYDALFILDEIHCYDEELVCILILVLQYLKQSFNVRLFLMSATFPEVLKNLLVNELKIYHNIRMPKEELKRYVRHRLHLLEGTIEENIDDIIYNLKEGKRVLVVCNTVKKAQHMYNQLKQYTSSHLLLHSYFAVKDRTQIEQMLLQSEKKENGFTPIQLLVGTQAIEVSLDLDFDTIYTELAPIDALIQRFGRVYRNRKRKIDELGDVNVCQEYDKGSAFIYNRELPLLERTLEKLRQYDEEVLTDEIIQDILNTVYGKEYQDILDAKLDDLRRKFRYITFYPLEDYSKESEAFFKQFDGIKLCPEIYFEEYKQKIEQGLYVEAEGYMITVREQKIKQYLKERKIALKPVNRKHRIFIAYKDYFGYGTTTGLQEKDIKPEAGLFA